MTYFSPQKKAHKQTNLAPQHEKRNQIKSMSINEANFPLDKNLPFAINSPK